MSEDIASNPITALNLQPDFVAWINRESARIATLTEDLTDMARSSKSRPLHPDLAVKKFGPKEIIGEPIASISEAGKIIARFYPHQGRFLGLRNEAMVDAQKVAERIWSRRDLCDLLSRTTVLELLLEHVGAAVRGIQCTALSDRIIQTVSERVRPLSIWVPIEDVVVEGEFHFGRAVLFSLSKIQLDAVLDSGGLLASTEEVRQYRENLHSKWSGTAVMRFEYIAEPKRAGELAAEQAADYMSLLQIFYGTPAMIMQLVSHAAPRGERPYRIREHIASAPQHFEYEQSVTEPHCQFIINSEERALMEQLGLKTVSNLAQTTTCEYDEKLRNSLLIYGRACYQIDPNDKLLQVMTAVETFGLRSGNEPIQATLADRFAFAISDDPGTRQEIARNFRAAYTVRSGRSHHGTSISDTEIVENFLGNAWEFFITAIRGVGLYRTREDFLDHLDRTKFGHKEHASS